MDSVLRSAATVALSVACAMIELEQSKRRFGLAAMCIGVGQGIAMIIERA